MLPDCAGCARIASGCQAGLFVGAQSSAPPVERAKRHRRQRCDIYGASAMARSGEPLAPWILSGVITSATTWAFAADSGSRFMFSTM